MSTMTNQVPQAIKTISASDGVQLEYEVLGGGEPVVILHGVCDSRGAVSCHRGLSGLYRLRLPGFLEYDNG